MSIQQDAVADQAAKERWAALAEAVAAERKSPVGGVEGGPSVVALLRQAEALGLPRNEAKQRLAEALDDPAVHEAWARWTAVDEKEELRLRLEILRHFRKLPSALLDFVFFFFRASDQTVYQTAALVLGCHLLTNADLRKRFYDYAASRGADLLQPIRLTGSRSNRRMFLVTAVSAGEPGSASAATHPDPLPAFLKQRPSNMSDLSAGMLAVDFRLGLPSADKALLEGADHFLKQLVAEEAGEWNRNSVQAWARILVNRSRGKQALSAASVGDLWSGLLHLLLSRLEKKGDGFGMRVALLRQIDELMRAAVFLPEAVQSDVVARLNQEGGEVRFYLGLRLAVWRRERKAISQEVTFVADSGSPELLALARKITSTKPSPSTGLTGDPAMEEEAALLGALLAPTVEKRQWLALSEERRSLIAFLLLDESLHLSLEVGRIAAILAAHGLDDASHDSDPEQFSPGVASFATVRILLRLINWEKAGVETFLDARLLHQIEDRRVLLALLPDQRKSELSPVLADAFEHRFRLGLTREEGFPAAQFLYQISVRRPHSSFYANFRDVVKDRIYATRDGAPVPLAEILVKLGEEALKLERGTGLSDLSGIPLPMEDSLAALLKGLRERLITWGAEKDLPAGFEGLANLLLPEHADASGGKEGLGRFIGRLALNNGVLLRSGHPVFSQWALEDLTREVQEICAGVREQIPELLPESFGEVAETRAAAEKLYQLVARIRAMICPSLPATERALFEAGLDRLEKEMADWLKGAEQLAHIWAGKGGVRPRAALLQCIGGLASPSLRRNMLTLLWDSLGKEARRGATDGRDAWDATYECLDWGSSAEIEKEVPASDLEAWRSLLGKAWCKMMDDAIEARHESRVSQLLRNPAFGPARGLSFAHPILEKARLWALDRYRLKDAKAADAGARKIRGLSSPGWGRTAGSFFFHFSAVWMALLVGGILMLDFGDPWKAMAQVNDLRGISLTFALGVLGAFVYVFGDLRRKVQTEPGKSAAATRLSILARTFGFLALCLGYSFSMTAFLWFLLSGTEEVVHGAGAILHIVVWAGFALFVGIFFGLMAKTEA